MATEKKTVSIHALKVGDVLPGGAVVVLVSSARIKMRTTCFNEVEHSPNTFADILGPNVEVTRQVPALKPFRAEVCTRVAALGSYRVIPCDGLPEGTPVAVVPLPLPETVKLWMSAKDANRRILSDEALATLQFLRSLEGE